MKSIIINIESLASTGVGVGTIMEEGHKRSIFIPFTCPGDRVKVKIVEQKKKYYVGELDKIIKPSHLREEIRCQHYQICGGCNLLHIKYASQIEHKKKFIEFMFKDLIEHIDIKIISGSSDFYRKKIRIQSENKKVGFFKRQSDEIINIEECYLIDQSLLNEFDYFVKHPGEYVLVAEEGEMSFWNTCDEITIDSLKETKAPTCTYTLNDQEILFTPSCFIQSNTKLNEQLVNYIADIVNSERPKKILELFSGIGNFSSQISVNTVCVEGDKIANYFAKINAKNKNNICKDVFKFLDVHKDLYDLVLIDPPRTGMKKGYLEKVSKLANTIIYVSCDPKSLKEDIKSIGWKVDSLTFVDMFPHTHHVELVAILKK